LGESPDKVGFTYRDSQGRTHLIADQVKDPHETMAGVKWFGLDTRYFVFAVVPGEKFRKDSGVQVFSGFENGQPSVGGRLVIPTNGQKQFDVPMRVYFGPKHMESLVSADPILADTIDFGWTSVIAIPILGALKWLHNYVGNYGFAIILLTIAIKIVLFPLMYKSMKAMSKMAKLQPQLNALREKHKDDKEKLNAEMMNFMKVHGYNPVSGCLPILAQMPIFFALYRVLFNSIELYQAPFVLWIHDLSLPDPFFVTPVILTGLMYLQQKLSPNTTADPMQQKMLQFMPVMFGVFMLMLPAGLTIYMVINSVMTIGQQYYLNHKLGVYEATKNNNVVKAVTTSS
jgi:YidC/Oxa1 family membrane protein insertase